MRSQERGALYGPEVFAVIRESLDDVCAERLTPLMAQHLEACGLDPGTAGTTGADSFDCGVFTSGQTGRLLSGPIGEAFVLAPAVPLW